VHRGYLSERERYRYIREKTVDDYILDVGWDVWTGNRAGAIKILMWLMDKFIKDIDPDGKEIENGRKESSFYERDEKIEVCFPSENEKGEDWDYGRYYGQY
jgi:hypothetical protein